MCDTPTESLNLLPQPLRKLVPNPNFSPLNLSHLPTESPATIVQCLTTQTLLQLLQPPALHPRPAACPQPIVLVFCQPSEQLTLERERVLPYTPVAYVNWLQAAGARCVPLPYDTNQGSIEFLLERSHGLLIPGGGSNLYRNFGAKEGQGPVMAGFMRVWRYLMKMWARGVWYPVWGTCLGLEMLLLALTGDTKILSSLNSRGHQTQIYSHYQNSRMLAATPLKLRLKMQHCRLLNFQHSYGISVKKFLASPKLLERLKVVQVSQEKDSKWFCSGLEGKTLPIFLSQYHPEKQAYQWTRTGEIRHNRDSIELSQYLAGAFLRQCRACKPAKQFGSATELVFYGFHQYRQIHTPQKMYKVYAIDYKYRDNDKQIRKQVKSKRSSSIAAHSKKIIL